MMDKMVSIGVGLATVYWLLDSLIYFLLSNDITLFQALLSMDMDVIARRMLAISFFMMFGSHAQYTITQRRQTEEALQKSEERYRTILESIEDGYYELDIAGNFTFFNESLCKVLGYLKDEIMGINIRQSVDEESTIKILETLDTVHKTGLASEALDWKLIRRDGSKRYIEASVSLIEDTEDKATGFRGIIRDVSRRKEAEALQHEKVAAEAASRSKSEFLANMSHEIRTPLNSIIGLVELMRGTDLSPDQREDLDVVISAAYALLSVINDILDFSKIEAGKLELEEVDFNLRDFIGETLKIMAIKAHEKGLELAYRVAPDIVSDHLVGDPSRFRQILLNLVGNAIKFTDEGEVVVSVHQEQQTENQVYLHFSVADTGVGIPKEKTETIFSAFKQADGSISRRFGGTGLGLAVSAQLVNLMGGRIWVESEAGQGSSFQFTSSFLVQADKPDKPDTDDLPAGVDIRGVRVLVVDDNATSREILQEMLESWQLFPKAASGMKEAQQIFGQVEQSGIPFDVILIDSDMPETDGFSLARWIKSKETIHSKIIMMLTSSNQRGQIDLQDLGARATVTKPVRPSDLLDAIIIALGLKVPVPEVPIKVAEQIPGAKEDALQILVAEDTPFNQKFILRLLDRWGHQAVIAENGREALEAWSEDSFDIVLMDIQMPEMDGLEATRAIRETEKKTGGHIPIIALTAHAMKGDRERCLAAGMDEYISKPISPEMLYKAIQDLVTGESQDAPGIEASEEEALPAFSKQTLLKAFEHDWSFFEDVVDMFVSDYPAMMTTIREAVKTKDAVSLQRAAHSLKGMLRNFQAEAGAKKALELEEMGRQSIFEDADQAYELLSIELAKLEKILLDLVKEVQD